MSGYKSHDLPIISTTRLSFSPQMITVLLINQMIGPSICHIDLFFNCGIAIGPIITVLTAVLSIYTMFLYTKTMANYHLSTVDEVIDRIFGRAISLIFAAVVVVFCLFVQVSQFHYFCKNTGLIIKYYEPTAPDVVLDPLFINSIFLLIYIIPWIHTISLKTMFAIAVFGITAIFFLFVTVAYDFAVEKTAKSPTDVVYFSFGGDTIRCFTLMTYSMQIFPFNYPGIRHLKHNSTRMWMVVVGRAISFAVLVIFFIGIPRYYATEIVYANTDTIKLCILFAQLLILASSIPALMNPARYTIQNCFLRLTSVDPTMWYFCGYVFEVGALVLSSLFDKMMQFMEFFLSTFSVLLAHIVPAILFLITFKTSSYLHFTLAIIILLFCIVMVILNALYIFAVL